MGNIYTKLQYTIEANMQNNWDHTLYLEIFLLPYKNIFRSEKRLHNSAEIVTVMFNENVFKTFSLNVTVTISAELCN